jgi:membrane protease YdiL (CAAX protease family)
MIVPIGFLIWLLGAYPEEYGWRGYALPRLLEKNSPLVASLILGAVWGIWHLPLHFIPTTTQFVIPIWQYLLLTLVLSVLYTWLYLGTGGNLFIASLFHASGNIAGALIPYWTSNIGRWVSFLILLVPAVVIAFRWQKKGNFTKM